MQSNPNENFVSNHLQEKGKTKENPGKEEKETESEWKLGRKIFSVGNKERDARKITGDTFKKEKEEKKTYFKVSGRSKETFKTVREREKETFCLVYFNF